MNRDLPGNFLDKDEELSVTKQALIALESLEQRLTAAENAAKEPVAIVGIGCRFPGNADGADGFWELLKQGRDAVSIVPADRWDWSAFYHSDSQKPGKMNARFGGFLSEVDKFDAEFFGISPREARQMDPQQRIVLEVAWEALEDAGLPPERLKGSRTGVFIGIYNSDYFLLQHVQPSGIDLHSGTGTVHALAANRLSYLFDFRGPSLAIDTSCSSSLVAVHQAVQSLRLRESDIALAGGVNLMLTPSTSIATSKLVNMAADGRCKTFDKRADGIVRGEGCGVVVLKRLSDALEAGDAIWAVIRGTAVNQDGRSNGLTAPNGLAQEALIRQALENAGVEAGQIGYVETHGTGTPLGDPIEIEAVSAALGEKSSGSNPCYLGSVKTNFGHLEAAAGIAGLIKAVLSLHQRAIPPQLHFTEPNPKFDLEGTRLRISTKLNQWDFSKERRFAGVSAFSIGGTNAHLILEEAPEIPSEEKENLPPQTGTAEAAAEVGKTSFILPLSARTPDALNSLIAKYSVFLGQRLSKNGTVSDERTSREDELRNLTYTAAARRSHHHCRKAFVASSAEEMAAQLNAHHGLIDPISPAKVKDNGAVMVFPGQGSQWVGMGMSLLKHEPLFRQKVKECGELVKQYLGFDLLSELEKQEDSRLQETEVAQPAIWAVEVGLSALLKKAGIPVTGVIGHSVGEVAAAQIAGMLTPEEAARVVCARARLLHKIEGHGGMLALATEYENAVALARRYDLDLAAFNSDRNIVLSGDINALDACEKEILEKGEWCRRLAVRGAYHSRHVRILQDELRAALNGLPQRTSRIPFYSTVKTGAIILDESLDIDYWIDNLCEAVNFQAAVGAAYRHGQRFFIEAGAQRVLQTDIRLTLKKLGGDSQVIGLQQHQSDNHKTLLSALGNLYEKGFDLSWDSICPKGAVLRLPAYPWQRKSYWLESQPKAAFENNSGQPEKTDVFFTGNRDVVEKSVSLCEDRLPTALPLFRGRLSLQTHPELNEHRINGDAVLSIGHYIQAFSDGLELTWSKKTFRLEDLAVHKMLRLPENAELETQLAVLPDGNEADLRFFAGNSANHNESSGWELYASAKGVFLESYAMETPELESLLKRLTKSKFPAAQGNPSPANRSFQIKETRLGEREVLVNLAPSRSPDFVSITVANFWRELVSASLQFVPELISITDSTNGGIPIPTRIHRTFYQFTKIPASIWIHLERLADSEQPDELLIKIDCFDEEGNPFGKVEKLAFRLISEKSGSSNKKPNLNDLIYVKEWIQQPLSLKPERIKAAENGFHPSGNKHAIAAHINNGNLPEAASLQKDLLEYRLLLPQLEGTAAPLILRAFNKLGWTSWRPGEHFTIASVIKSLGIEELHVRLLFRLFQILSEEGFIEPAGSGEWIVKRYPDDTYFLSGAMEPMWEELSEKFKSCTVEIELLRRCGENLGDVLTGKTNPLELLFAASKSNASSLYNQSPVARYVNELAAGTVKNVSEAFAFRQREGKSSGKLRILEVGGGTGATTASILPVIKDACAEYLFTDIAPSLLRKAGAQFSDYEFFRTQLFDLEKSPFEQGFGEKRFDLIIGANVLHTTADLRQSVEHLKALLAEDGFLMIIEGTTSYRWIDLTFGLTAGWWKFADERARSTDLRGNFNGHPLLTAQSWTQLLKESGFADVFINKEPAPGTAEHQNYLNPDPGHTVFLAGRQPISPLFLKNEDLKSGKLKQDRAIPEDFDFKKSVSFQVDSIETCLIFGEENCHLTRALAKRLSDARIDCRLVLPDSSSSSSSSSATDAVEAFSSWQTERIDPEKPAIYRDLYRKWMASSSSSSSSSSSAGSRAKRAAVVWLWSVGTPEPLPALSGTIDSAEAAASEQSDESGKHCRRLLYLMQALAEGAEEASEREARLWIVTAEAQSAETQSASAQSAASGEGDAEPMSGVAAAGVWGLGVVLEREHPELLGALIDLERETTRGERASEGAEQIYREMFAHQGESGEESKAAASFGTGAGAERRERQVCYRRGQRYAARLRRARIEADEQRQGSNEPERGQIGLSRDQERESRVREDGWYLVSGGLGGLGLAVGGWLLAEGAGRVVLVSRGRGRGKWREAVAEYERRYGAERVSAVESDIGEWRQVRELIEEENRRGEGKIRLRGIIHSAGEVSDAVLVRQSREKLESVMRAKVRGGWNLHYASIKEEAELDFFVLFSSAVTLLGMTGLGSYTAANMSLDGLAHYRRSQKLPALSINWSGWEGLGMAQAVGRQRTLQWSSQGLYPLKPEQALRALDCLIERKMTQAGVMKVDWKKFAERLDIKQMQFFSELFERPSNEAENDQPPAPVSRDLYQQLSELRSDLRLEFLSSKVEKLTAQILGCEPGERLSHQRSLSELGLDSLMSVELRNLLAKSSALSLPATLIFEASTITAIAEYLLHAYQLSAQNGESSIEEMMDEALLLEVLNEIEDLSEEEARAELARLTGTLLSPEAETGTKE